MNKVNWYINGKYFGSSEIENFLIHGEYRKPSSILYFCPICGDVWAKIEVEGAIWTSYPRKCKKHGCGLVGVFGWDYPMPDEVRKYEFERIIELDLDLENEEVDEYTIRLIAG